MKSAKTLHMNSQRQETWDLFTHAGYLTKGQHDPNGYCTYLFGMTGAKIWSFNYPKLPKGQRTRHELLDDLKKIYIPGDHEEVNNTYTLLLEESDVLYVSRHL